MKIDLEQWRELASPFYEVYPNEPAERAGVDVEVREVDDLFIARIATPSQVLVHDPATRKHVNHDYLLFERFYAGGGRAQVGETGFTVAPDRLHLIDMSQRYVSDKGRSFSRGVCIPHAALGYVPGERPPFISLGLDTARGRLLGAAHAELVAAQDDPGRDDAGLITQAFIALVRQLMLGQAPDDAAPLDRDLPLKLLMRDYIAANLHRADLDADSLAAGFGISRATLYRHFETEGGVARYIRDRRLDRCFFELAGAKPVRGQVVAVARRWHFKDPSGFNRIYRQRFGAPPSETLAPTTPQPGSGAPREQARIVDTWLDRFQHR